MINYDGLIRHLKVADNEPFGLLSQQTSPTANYLYNEFPNRLKCLFAPEHGWFGFAAAGEPTNDEIHPLLQIPIHSLYGENRRPTPAMFEGISRVVIDLQDIGVRCYTYLATLKNMLEAASEAGVKVTILDRPIPLGGILDGPCREMAFASFVAPLNIPLCHGMTPAECAKYIKLKEKLDLDITTIKLKDWDHTTRSPWLNFIPPSPAIKSWDSAALYPATVFTEAFPALDCDRTGNLAFRVLGAPWLDTNILLSDIHDSLSSCGIESRTIRYKPQSGLYQNQTLNGLLLTIDAPDAFYPVTASTVILAAIINRYPQNINQDANWSWLAKLYGTANVKTAIESDSLSELFQNWIDNQDAYLTDKVNIYTN